jgi:hypothetical protein
MSLNIDKRPRSFISNLFGKYEIVYRPLRVERGREVVEVYVEKPLDGMKGAWIELLTGKVLQNNGFSREELKYVLYLVNKSKDMIYTESRDVARGLRNANRV